MQSTVRTLDTQGNIEITCRRSQIHGYVEVSTNGPEPWDLMRLTVRAPDGTTVRERVVREVPFKMGFAATQTGTYRIEATPLSAGPGRKEWRTWSDWDSMLGVGGKSKLKAHSEILWGLLVVAVG
jgi:hypothetical protein